MTLRTIGTEYRVTIEGYTEWRRVTGYTKTSYIGLVDGSIANVQQEIETYTVIAGPSNQSNSSAWLQLETK